MSAQRRPRRARASRRQVDGSSWAELDAQGEQDLRRDRYADAEKVFRDLRRHPDSRSDRARAARATAGIARALHGRQDLAGALDAYRDALGTLDGADSSLECGIRLGLADALVDIGDIGAARRQLDAAERLVDGDVGLTARAAVLSCEITLLTADAGAPERAAERARLERALAALVGDDPTLDGWCRLRLAELALRDGDAAGALAACLEVKRAWRFRPRFFVERAHLRLVAAEACLAAGKPLAAGRRLLRAYVVFRRYGLDYQTALARYSMASLLVQHSRAGRRVDKPVLRWAARILIPTLLFIDSRRLTFPENQRLAWARRAVAPFLALAIELALLLEDSELVADLIATTRIVGVPAIEYDPAVGPELISARRTSPITDSADNSDGRDRARLSTQFDLAWDHAPTLQMPNGRIALGAYRRAAERLYRGMPRAPHTDRFA